MRRLIFCFDGTWQNLSQNYLTNVALTASSVLPISPDGEEQIVYYSEGVGNARGIWPALTAKFGGAFGSGLEDDLLRAYHFLSFNYQIGDEIFIFGFSRGAFTARSFCGLIDHCGILKREFIEHERFMISDYKLKKAKQLKIMNMKRNFTHSLTNQKVIKFLGIWDTVCARGLPEVFKIFRPYNRKYDFHMIGINDAIEHSRHAVSLDETRNMFPPEIWSEEEITRANSESDINNFEQLWFAGDHGNVGGGGRNFLLSNIALIWIWEKAIQLGMGVQQATFEARQNRTYLRSMNSSEEITYPTSFLKGLPYSLGGFNPRKGLVSESDLHDSVFTRMADKEGYIPKAYEAML